MAITSKSEPVLSPDPERPAIGALAALLAQTPEGTACILGPNDEPTELPASVHRLLATIVHELAQGNAVTIAPVHADLTTQQAAELLNVSRPFLIKLLESGAIPFHRVGTHRRVRLQDVLTYRRARSEARLAALAEMARDAQELGLYE